MGVFFNTQIMNLKKLTTSKEMEKRRQEFNRARKDETNARIICNEKTEESRSISQGTKNVPESGPDVLLARNATRATRPKTTGRTRKARSDKGVKRSRNPGESRKGI